MPQEQTYPDQKEQLRESEVLEFGAYERFCNQNNRSARKCGILGDEIYTAAVVDPSTIFADIDGKLVPALVDIRYGLGLGYDERRANAYAGTEHPVSVLAVPIGDLDPVAQQAVIDSIAAAEDRSIFYADNEGRDSTTLTKGLTDKGVTATEIPLLDHRCRAENRQASLSLYVCDNTLPEFDPEHSPRVPLAEVQRRFDERTLPDIEDRGNATLLRNGASFTPDELDDIWDLYNDKFELLGENHPISMEDGKEDFLGTLTDPSTTVSIRYADGKPACFAFFTDTLDGLYWLNQDYLTMVSQEKSALTTIFFPGIVARGASGNYAHEIIELFAHEAAKVDMNARIVFENTNLSEMYVPRIVQNAIASEAAYDVGKPVKIDQTHYRLVKTKA